MIPPRVVRRRGRGKERHDEAFGEGMGLRSLGRVCDPSTEDLALTRRIRDALAMIDVPLLDHIIVTSTSYLSLAKFLHWNEKRPVPGSPLS